MAQEHLEEVELNAGEREAPVTAVRPRAWRGPHEVAHAQEAPLALETAAQQCPQAGQQLGQQ